MEKSARTYTITEETLNKVKAELMEEFDKYANMGIHAKNKEELSTAVIGFKRTAVEACTFVQLAPDDYPVYELIISILTAQKLR